MKKNITINLYGQLYAIDEDAYKLLEKYLDNMKSYFKKIEGGEDIADDIEHRVAEIFSEYRMQGVEAITIEHVQDIIKRIGNPEQMDANNGEEIYSGKEEKSENMDNEKDYTNSSTSSAKSTSSFSGRKLFRDPNDKMLGGVMSGLCHYFGSNDPLPWRILMVILAFFSFSTIGILYLIAWAIIPQALTAEQQLQMKGQPVNPKTLSEEVMRGMQYGATYLGSNNFQANAKGCLGTILSLFVFILKISFLIIVGICILILLFFIIFLAFVTFGGAKDLIRSGIENSEFMQILSTTPGITYLLWGIGISTFICLFIIIYALVRSFISRPTDKPLSRGTCITLTLIAVLCGATAITLTAMTGVSIAATRKDYYRKNNTINGIYLDSYQRSKLDADGWTVYVLDNCDTDGWIFDTTDDFSEEGNDVDYLFFEKGEEKKPMRVQLETDKNLSAGWYHIEAIGFSKGLGSYVYARTDSNKVFPVMLPSDENMKYMNANELNEIDYFKKAPNGSIHVKLPGVSVDINGNGKEVYEYNLKEFQDRVSDWSFIKSVPFYHKGGILTLGTTNIPSIIGEKELKSEPKEYGLLDVRVVADTIPSDGK